ncbi:MAG: peroxide stress protein YaaA [Legionella sp.]|uniref:peroxide stress protein YaaA n=1 Tax=Legionella sp. TaxID=459 RepID=UPI0039E5DDCD
MLILLSPAKKLLKATKPYSGTTSLPLFPEKTKNLVNIMQSKSVADIATLMDLSQNLALLNYERYQEFALDGNSPHAYPALFLFQGDVYQGLQAKTWNAKTVEYAQSHLRILSGLYGLLKPLDNIQPYRLEMGVHLENPKGKNLYEFWQDIITKVLNQQLKEQKSPIVINLASSEYFKVVNEKQLQYPMLTVNFYERKKGQLKMIGIYAKKARGTLAKFMMQNEIDDVEGIKSFQELGYEYHLGTSSANHLDFVRGK